MLCDEISLSIIFAFRKGQAHSVSSHIQINVQCLGDRELHEFYSVSTKIYTEVKDILGCGIMWEQWKAEDRKMDWKVVAMDHL